MLNAAQALINKDVLVLACLDQTERKSPFAAALESALATALKHNGKTIDLRRLRPRKTPLTEAATYSPPLSVSSMILTSELHEVGIPASLVSTSFSKFFSSPQYETLRSRSYSHVFISSTFIPSVRSLEKIVARVKQLFPHAYIIVGGRLLHSARKAFCVSGVDFFCLEKDLDIAPSIVLGMWRELPAVLQRAKLKSAEQLAMEVLKLKKNAAKHLVFFDRNFTRPKTRLQDFCRLLSEREVTGAQICSFARVSDIDRETLQLMEEAGWYMAYLRVGSGSNDILRRMRKGFVRSEVQSLYDTARAIQSRVHLWAGFKVGFPGETDSTIAETLELITSIDARFLSIQPLQIGVHSELYKRPETFGLELEIDPVTEHVRAWRHATMSSEEAVLKSLQLFCSVTEETQSLLLGNLQKTVKTTYRFDPLRNEKDFHALRRLQEAITLALRMNEGVISERKAEEKINKIWEELEGAYVQF